MPSYDDYVNETCAECDRQMSYRVVEANAWQGTFEVSRRGPSCWLAACTEHQARMR